MEVHFSPEQEARLSRIAQHNGTPAEQLVKQAVLRLMQEDEEIRAGIERGIEQANRGDLIDHDELVACFEHRMQAK